MNGKNSGERFHWRSDVDRLDRRGCPFSPAKGFCPLPQKISSPSKTKASNLRNTKGQMWHCLDINLSPRKKDGDSKTNVEKQVLGDRKMANWQRHWVSSPVQNLRAQSFASKYAKRNRNASVYAEQTHRFTPNRQTVYWVDWTKTTNTIQNVCSYTTLWKQNFEIMQYVMQTEISHSRRVARCFHRKSRQHDAKSGAYSCRPMLQGGSKSSKTQPNMRPPQSPYPNFFGRVGSLKK